MTGQDILRINGKSALESLKRILLTLIALGLVSIVAVAQADEGFTTESVAGTWAFTADGTIVPPAVPSATPVALVGIATDSRASRVAGIAGDTAWWTTIRKGGENMKIKTSLKAGGHPFID